MPTYTNTAKYLLRKLTGSNLISDVDAGIAALADDVDSKFAGYSEGVVASRPVSTGGTPGIGGRRYRPTDQAGREDLDNGTGWDMFLSAAALLAQWRLIGSSRLVIPGSTPSLSSGSIAWEDGTVGNGPTNSASVPAQFFPFRAADLAVTGLTTKLRTKVALLANGTAPGITFTAGLYLIASTGASGTSHSYTISLVGGTTVAIASPAANSETIAVSAEFNAPADGPYILGLATSGTMPANANVHASLHLEAHHI